MSKYTEEQWQRAKILYKKGESLREISEKVGISKSAIHKRANKEGWSNSTSTAPTKFMDNIARDKYYEVIEYLKDIGKYKPIDEVLIERYARAYSLYLHSYAQYIKSLQNGDFGSKTLYQISMNMSQSQSTMERLEKQLGIGAYNRDRLKIENNEEDEFIDFLGGND